MTPSIVLSLLLHFGGGYISRSGFPCLHGNSLLGRPLPLAYGWGKDGYERLYPAALVSGRVVPLTTAAQCREHDPLLYEACKALVILRRIQPKPPTPPVMMALAFAA